jgi:hypothetical protein
LARFIDILTFRFANLVDEDKKRDENDEEMTAMGKKYQARNGRATKARSSSKRANLAFQDPNPEPHDESQAQQSDLLAKIVDKAVELRNQGCLYVILIGTASLFEFHPVVSSFSFFLFLLLLYFVFSFLTYRRVPDRLGV